MTTKCNVLLAAGLLAASVLTGTAWAHGNVVPQAVETKGLTPIKDAGVSLDDDGWAAVNPYRSSPEHDKAVEIGASAYNQNCAACHGLEAKSGGIAPDLRMLDAGDAGDELFGGYNRYFWGRRIWNKIDWLPPATRRLLGRGISCLSVDSWDAINHILPNNYRVSNLGDKVLSELQDTALNTRKLTDSAQQLERLIGHFMTGHG